VTRQTCDSYVSDGSSSALVESLKRVRLIAFAIGMGDSILCQCRHVERMSVCEIDNVSYRKRVIPSYVSVIVSNVCKCVRLIAFTIRDG